jgi:CDP-6-deoxy-D-xylo-4-hexulose-3-dehydrase
MQSVKEEYEAVDEKNVLKEIEVLVKKLVGTKKSEFIPGKSKIPLNVPSFGHEEIVEALHSMLTRVTMGDKVRLFEEMFADYIGMKHAIMVNSGSSANLIALSLLTNPLTEGKISSQHEIIVPAVTWSTTIFPIINVGATPVLVDIDLESFNISTDQIENALSNKTRAIMPVHLLGNPCCMDRISEIARENDLFVVEDCCEAHGAEFNGKKAGSFGDMSAFSFFFSHHITTIEGGMVLVNDDEYSDIAKSLRAHGWIRERSDGEKIATKHPDIDKRFLFANIGFNLRPTEIQGAFGIHQLNKLEKFIEIRRDNARYLTKQLNDLSDYLLLPEEHAGSRHVWFGYPLTVKENAPFTRADLVTFLEQKGVETRPIMAGNLAEQPALKLFRHRIVGELKNARTVMRNSFFFGNHQGVGKVEREYIVTCIEEFIAKKGEHLACREKNGFNSAAQADQRVTTHM